MVAALDDHAARQSPQSVIKKGNASFVEGRHSKVPSKFPFILQHPTSTLRNRTFITLNRFLVRPIARKIRKAIGILICLLGTWGIIVSGAGLLGSRELASKTTAIMVAPLRANLKEQGITDESLSAILRGGQEATNLFQTLNRDQQMALTDFQETYTSISAAMTRMAEASRSSARTGLLLFIVIFLVGILIFRFRSIASPPLIPPAS